ncbi:MAG: hypothetical protein H7232_06670 [Aeromicrobium sp.]|nr:hypothetical protein [Burkholderiales bacterium]
MRYDVALDGGQFAGGTIQFMNGRKQVASTQINSREEAMELLGERNVDNIEAAKSKGKNSLPGTAKGKLQSEHLAYEESYTSDKKPKNVIEAGADRVIGEFDSEVIAWVAKRR